MEGRQGIEALFLFATEGILIADENGEIIQINPSAEKLFGYDKEELLGKKVEILIPQRFNAHHVLHREKYNYHPHARKMGGSLDLMGLKKDGTELPLEISLSPYTFQGKKLVIAFIVDITIRKHAEEKLKNYSIELELQVKKRTLILEEAIEELEKTKKELNLALEKEKDLNELKSRFVSMASHEFRTPLTAILSSASLIEDYTLNDHQGKRSKHVDRIKSAVNNLNDILGDFLSLSKIEEGRTIADYKIFNINELGREVFNEMIALCKKGQQIHYSHTGNDHVFLDPKLIRNIMINLISNAIKFTDENKNIYICHSGNDSTVNIEIRDEGIGIGEDDLEHLFERFFRGSNAVNIQGTGLGLNIVSKYVELMNGEIKIKSKLNEGSSFYISFPVINKR
jgi:PAS domain S-box-containing protein